MSHDRQTELSADPARQWPWVATAALVVLVAYPFWAFFVRQTKWAIEHQADWGHTLVIPLIAGYFVYLNREEILAKPFKTTWFGLVPVVGGLALYVFCAIGPLAVRHHNLQGLGVWSCIAGVMLLFVGWRGMKWIWFPLLYAFVFGQSISNRFMNLVTYPMQDITADGAYFAMKVLGVDIDITGNTLYVYDGATRIPLNVAEACSGMRMLMAFLALGVAMAYTGLDRFWQRAALVILAVPTAIFVNILRVMTLAFLSRFNTEFAAGDFHTFVGLVWLVPAFFIYLGLLWIIKRLVVEAPKQSARPA